MNSEQVWNKFSDQLKNFLQKRVADTSIADDLLQEVFVKIHLNLPKLKDDRKLENWVFQIAYNQLNDHYRRQKSLSTQPIDDVELATDQNSASHDLQDCLVPFIESLPETYKTAIILSEVEGLKQQEIAKRLGISLSGAKSRVQRGRALIKQHFVECCHFHIGQDGKLSGEHDHGHEDWNCDDDDCLVHPSV